MLWTLWRAILIDFFRLLLLATAVLVTVVAFAATVQPLADGKLTTDQAIRFMVYAIPPMLAYALPFAAGFAATLTYHRFAAENEITAAHAGGVSHFKLLVPAILSGLLLGGVLWGLNDRVIPRFLTRMEEMITRDFARIMVASLKQGKSATIGDTEIHADQVEQIPPEPGSPVQQQFLLAGVAMVETDSTGRIIIDGTAKRAWILMLPVWALNEADRARIADDDATAVILKFIDVTIYRNGAPQSADPLIAPAIPIPSMFQDDPKYATGAELRATLEDPDRMNFVDRQRIATARVMAAYECYAAFAAELAAGRPITLVGADGSRVRVLGSALASDGANWTITPLPETGRLEIDITHRNGRVDRVLAASAHLASQSPADDDPLADRSDRGGSRFQLALAGVRVLDASGSSTELAATNYANLMPQTDPLPGLLAMDSESIVEAAQPASAEGTPTHNPVIANAARKLRNDVDSLRREVFSKQQERWAMSAQCLVMVLCGSVMALRLKDATPLIVYLWSFFPGLFCVIMLESGQQAVHANGLTGLPVLWGAIAALGAVTLVAYRRLIRL
jgi:lipopolysaccharide export LptBFGC system permease protein LptF